MQTRPECLVCFMRQALATARRCTPDPAVHHRVILETGRILDRFDMRLSPPENAVLLYQTIAGITGVPDPFLEAKKFSNDFALSLRDRIEESIHRADDPLHMALRYAACANIIDYAAQHDFDPVQALERCYESPFVHDDYPLLRKRLRTGSRVLILTDNCGEIVFDGLLAEQIENLGARVTLAVRGRAIINDATLDDARACGLTNRYPVIDNGTGCPGTPLAHCSDRFRRSFFRADLIVSKGMGNFETLSAEEAPLFFLFTVKCDRVARHLNNRLRRKNADSAIRPDGSLLLLAQQENELATR